MKTRLTWVSISKKSLFRHIGCLFGLVMAILMVSCQFEKETRGANTSEEPEYANVAVGKKLVAQYCTGCHLAVPPRLADKDSWKNHILPAMAPKLGIPVLSGNQYYQVAGKEAASGIPYADWMKIVDYYQTLAPETMAVSPKPVPFVQDWSVFELKKPQSLPSIRAATTLVAIEPVQGRIYTSNATDNKLYQWNRQLQLVQAETLPSAVTSAHFIKEGSASYGVFTYVGTMLANDNQAGKVVRLPLGTPSNSASAVMATDLPRPVQAVPGDFNQDGRTDWVVCAFGHNQGGLYWLRQEAAGEFEKIPIREVAGATQAVVEDFNGDGWPDVMALFAHADEGIWLFLNDRKGSFTTKNILRFPPIYGSTSFQLVDFNGDGQRDIIYTCGDNSDYSRVLKPYHGLYIFLNKGDFTYKQAYFYPINGCTKAMSADFDQDGDLDMATIAFFSDLQDNPVEGLLCFEQDQPLQFIPHAVPVSSYGRWICMDVNDYDQDGDADIALGNYASGFINQEGVAPTWDQYLPLIVLENKNGNKEPKRSVYRQSANLVNSNRQ